MKQVRYGYRKLPVDYWTIIYEKFIPQYGMSYKEINKLFFGNKKVIKKVIGTIEQAPDSHDRLNTVK